MTERKQDAAADLLIREVDEDLKREQYERLWKQYGHYMIAAAVAVVLIVAGSQGWRTWRQSVQADEAGRFSRALELSATDKKQEAAAALELLAKESRTGYEAVAALTRAAMLADTGDNAGAVKAYEAIVADSGIHAVYRDLAAVKIGLLTIDTAEPADLIARMAPLTSGAWRFSALEVSGVAAMRAGDFARAREFYQRIADDAEAPQAIRARAAEMLAALGTQEKKN